MYDSKPLILLAIEIEYILVAGYGNVPMHALYHRIPLSPPVVPIIPVVIPLGVDLSDVSENDLVIQRPTPDNNG